MGPLGRGFDLRHIPQAGRIVLAGGGIGIFPLFYLAASLGDSSCELECYSIFGFRSAAECFLEDELRKLGRMTILSSDSGGLDFHGNVPAALEAFLADTNVKALAIFSCGPEAMLKAVSSIGRRKEIPVQVSLETRMGCGIGLCRGCSVDLIDEGQESGFRRVRCCKEGPVFPAEKIIWPQEEK